MSEVSGGLVVEDVTVRYGDLAALDRFSLTAVSGEIVAVVGPSGSGKSTLLRAVAGLEPLTSGRILLDGRDLAGVPTHRRGLGLMFQDHGLFTHLDVAGNIAYGLRTAGASNTEQAARVAELLDLVGLRGFEHRHTSQLSGGEAQRVALARALAPAPRLLMLDEPLGSLDRALRDQLTGELRRLLTGLGQTALHVTHDQSEAFALADRVVVMGAGRPAAVDTPSELWADPGSRFVAEFLGHPNIWTVTVAADGAVDLAGRSLGSLPADHPMRRRPGPQLVVLPATALTLAVPPAGGESVPTLEVRVVEAVFRHGVHEVTAELDDHGGRPAGGETATSPAAVSVSFTAARPVSVGQELRLLVEVAALRPLTDE